MKHSASEAAIRNCGFAVTGVPLPEGCHGHTGNEFAASCQPCDISAVGAGINTCGMHLEPQLDATGVQVLPLHPGERWPLHAYVRGSHCPGTPGSPQGRRPRAPLAAHGNPGSRPRRGGPGLPARPQPSRAAARLPAFLS